MSGACECRALVMYQVLLAAHIQDLKLGLHNLSESDFRGKMGIPCRDAPVGNGLACPT